MSEVWSVITAASEPQEIPKQLPWELQALNGTISSSELISEDNLAMVEKIAINFWVQGAI